MRHLPSVKQLWFQSAMNFRLAAFKLDELKAEVFNECNRKREFQISLR